MQNHDDVISKMTVLTCDTVPNISDAKNGKSHLYSGGSNLALSVLYPIVLLGNLNGATIQPKSIFRDQHIECFGSGKP